MKPNRRSPWGLSAPLVCAALFGCSAVPNIAPVRPSSLAKAALALPLLIEFREGDRIPLDLAVGGDLLRSEVASPPVVIVKRRFFLLLTKDGPPRISLDGKSLGGTRGSFSAGIGVEKGGVPKASVRIDLNERR